MRPPEITSCARRASHIQNAQLHRAIGEQHTVAGFDVRGQIRVSGGGAVGDHPHGWE